MNISEFTNYQNLYSGAGGRNRTGTSFAARRILSPVRLPIPPLRQTSIIIGQMVVTVNRTFNNFI
jgi:hypothetical protein